MKGTKRKLLGIVAAFVLAAAGTTLLVAYVQSAHDDAAAQEQLVDVLVVRRTIAEGTPADEIQGAVALEQVPARLKAKGAVGDVAQLGDDVAAVELLAGEQVVRERFVAQEEQARGDVPPGMHEVTLELEPERVVGGQLRPGSTVAVLASFEPFDIYDSGVLDLPEGAKTPNTTHIILHKVLVTEVQHEPEGGDRWRDKPFVADADLPLAPPGKLLVTLALEAPDVERVVFTKEFGRVWLSAEPLDASEDGTTVITRGNVYG